MATPTVQPQAHTARILVVEDEAALRGLIGHQLELLGYSVSTAVDGRDAVKALNHADFDLVITDQDMPHMTGEMLAAVVRQTQPGLPVVMLTGSVDDYPFLPSGVRQILRKPFGMQSLRSTINAALGREE